MKKFILFSVVFIFISSQAFSVEVGIGIAFDDDTGTIIVPINVSKTLRIEPFLGMSTSTGNSITTSYIKTGVGVYGLVAKDGLSSLFYYGGRLIFNSSSETNITSSSGQELVPVFGFEYLFSKEFSIGGEAYYSFKTDSTKPAGGNSYTSSSTSTGSQILIRYYFK